MSLDILDRPAVLHRYDQLLRLLAQRGRGRTMADLGAAWALAQALETSESDSAAVASLSARLGLQEPLSCEVPYGRP